MSAVTVVRGRRKVLDGVHLAASAAETIALLGPNGAGKSTLLRCLAGALRPDCGEARWRGRPVTQSPDVRREIGFLGHESGLYSELTALENLVFAGRMYGIDRPKERAGTLLHESSLERVARCRVGALSQGIRRRLAVCRALVHEPTLILLDEPFASLDVEGRRWLEGLFQKWRSTGRTVLFANHDICQSRTLADREVWLQAGRVETPELPASQLVAARRSA